MKNYVSVRVINNTLYITYNTDQYDFNLSEYTNSKFNEIVEDYQHVMNNDYMIDQLSCDLYQLYEHAHSNGEITIRYDAHDIASVWFAGDIDKTNKEAATKRYHDAIAMLMRRLEHEFEITNVHDQKYIANKISNYHSKYKGNISSIRVCYSDSIGTMDKLYRYILKNHYGKNIDELYYNVVTGNYIKLGLSHYDTED